MFENKIIRGIHISRFIMSWIRSGGVFGIRDGYGEFHKWLKTLVINGTILSDDEITDIMMIARNGKLELEVSAKKFIQDNAQKDSEEEA